MGIEFNRLDEDVSDRATRYVRLRDRLRARGIGPDTSQFDESLLSGINAPLVIGDAILERDTSDFAGTSLAALNVERGPETDTVLPAFVLQARQRIPKPSDNRDKAVLTQWRLAERGDGRVPTLKLSKSDFWTSQAVAQSKPQIEQEIRSGTLQLSDFPKRLDTVVLVVTADEELVIYQRAPTVDFPYEWEASMGEQINSAIDQDPVRGVISPAETVWRALRDPREMNLPDEIVATAETRCIAMVTEWSKLLSNLIVRVRLPRTPTAEVRHYFRRAERIEFDAVPFSLSAILDLFIVGRHQIAQRTETSNKIQDVSRMSLLLVVLDAFGFDEVVKLL